MAFASRLESTAKSVVTERRAIVAFAAYAALALALSAAVQRSINLSNWHPSQVQVLGPDTNGRHFPGGRILRLEITDRVFLPGSDREVTSEGPGCALGDASSLPPALTSSTAQEPFTRRDALRPGVPLPGRGTASILCLSGQAWQATPVPILDLAKAIQKNRTFTLRILYAPVDAAAHVVVRICSISEGRRRTNLELTQDGRDLTSTLCTAVLGVSRYWDLKFPGALRSSQPTDIVLTYDGDELAGYIDGTRNAHSLRLGPGAALVSRFKGVNPYNVGGYDVLYMMLVFAPLGALLRLGVRESTGRKPSTWIPMAAAVLLPPLLQEGIVSSVRGSPFHLASAILGCCLIAGGFLTSPVR